MGASFALKQIEGSKTKKEVEQAFEDAQYEDRYENGHSYSGGFGMCRGLSFRADTFPSVDAAEGWLLENAEKWEDALCVTVINDGKPTWVIGAWCAS
jgi:hypothetical protein